MGQPRPSQSPNSQSQALILKLIPFQVLEQPESKFRSARMFRIAVSHVGLLRREALATGQRTTITQDPGTMIRIHLIFKREAMAGQLRMKRTRISHGLIGLLPIRVGMSVTST